MLPWLVPALVACGPRPAPVAGGEATPEPVPDEVHLLLINDTYRIEGDPSSDRGGFARVRTLRAELERQHGEVLVLHAGDFLFPSFLSRTYKGAQMVDVLGLLDGDAEAADERLLVTFLSLIHI